MPLTGTPPINLLDIYTEFEAPIGTPLTSMVRGGAYVPDSPNNSSVPTSPPIDLLDFLGAENGSAHELTQGVAQGGDYGFYADPVNQSIPQQIGGLQPRAFGVYDIRGCFGDSDSNNGDFRFWITGDQTGVPVVFTSLQLGDATLPLLSADSLAPFHFTDAINGGYTEWYWSAGILSVPNLDDYLPSNWDGFSSFTIVLT